MDSVTTKALTIVRATAASLALGAIGAAGASEVPVTVQAEAVSIVADAVVYVEPLSADAVAVAKRNATVDQIGKEFVPLASTVRVGTAVDFPNSDNIRHQVYSFSPAKVFNLKSAAPPHVGAT